MKEYNGKTSVPLNDEPLFQKMRDYELFKKFGVSITVKNGKASFGDIVGVVNQNGEEIRVHPNYKFKNGSEIVYEMFSTAFSIDMKELHSDDRAKQIWKRVKQLSREGLPNQTETMDDVRPRMSQYSKIKGKQIENPFLQAINVISELCSTGEELEDLSSEHIERIISQLPEIKEFRKFDEYENNLNYNQKLQVFMGMAYLYNLGFEKRNPELKGSIICPLSKIFEYYVLNRLKNVFESYCSIDYQKRIPYVPKGPNGNRIGMVPDFIMRCEANCTTVLDAKHKAFTTRRCYDDLHQITSYITAIRRNEHHCGHGVLIYPKTNGEEFDDVFGDSDEWFFFVDFDKPDAGMESLAIELGVLKKDD